MIKLTKNKKIICVALALIAMVSFIAFEHQNMLAAATGYTDHEHSFSSNSTCGATKGCGGDGYSTHKDTSGGTKCTTCGGDGLIACSSKLTASGTDYKCGATYSGYIEHRGSGTCGGDGYKDCSSCGSGNNSGAGYTLSNYKSIYISAGETCSDCGFYTASTKAHTHIKATGCSGCGGSGYRWKYVSGDVTGSYTTAISFYQDASPTTGTQSSYTRGGVDSSHYGEIKCSDCYSSAHRGYIKCTTCGGDSAVTCTKCDGTGYYGKCTRCNGKGVNYKCQNSSCAQGYNDDYDNWKTESDYNSYCYTTENTYTIKFNANGGSGSMSNMTSCYYDNSYTLTANAFTKTGYTFLGWSTSSTATSATYANKASVSKLSSTNGATVNLYAVWKANSYNMVYYPNGGNGSSITDTYTYGHAYSIRKADTYTRSGYTFNGWNTNAAGSGSNYTAGASGTWSATSNISLYAKWKANSYTITLQPNGGECSKGSVSVTYDANTNSSLASCLPTRTGYKFMGWYTALEGGTKVYAADGTCANDGTYFSNSLWKKAGNVTLYAQWERIPYTITYNSNGGTTTSTEVTSYYDEAIDLSLSAEKEGYKFIGWNTDKNATSGLQSIKMPASNVTLYAIYSISVSDVSNHNYPEYSQEKADEVYLVVWETGNTANYRKYSLTYKSDSNIMVYKYELDRTDVSSFVSGIDGYCYQVVAYDNAGNHSVLKEGTDNPSVPPDTFPIPAKYLQTVEHYIYDAVLGDWMKFDTITDLILEGETYTPAYITPPAGYQTANIDGAYVVSKVQTSNAYYNPIDYTLSFDANGGSCNVAQKTVTYNSYYGYMPTPTKKGHTFLGWYTDKDAGTLVASSDRYTTAGDTTLYAHWTVNSYEVTYDYWTNGGTATTEATKSVTYGGAVDLSTSATKNGWTFIGWNTDPNATSKLTSITMSDEGVVLYAIYKKEITVTIVEQKDTGKATRTLSETIYNRETEGSFSMSKVNIWSGWTLLGWTTETDAEASPSIGIGTIYKTDENKTLYALYSSSITLAYDTNGSAVTIEDQTEDCYYNACGNSSYPTFIVVNSPELNGHSFVEWQDEAGNRYQSGESIIFTKHTILTAKWDKYPELEVYNRYFTLGQAKNGEITEDALLEKVVGKDKEDGTLVNGTDVIVKNYNESTFTGITADQNVEITYQATDSFGNTIEKTVTITVTDTTAKKSAKKTYVRFISNQFLKDSAGNMISANNGGLEETSIWRTNLNYSTLLQETLQNTKTSVEKKKVNAFGNEWEIEVAGSGEWNKKEETWVFTRQDIQEMKSYTGIYGHVLNAMEKFFELFNKCKTQ